MKKENKKQNLVSFSDRGKLQKFLSKHKKLLDTLNKENNELAQLYSLYDELLKITDSFLKTIKGKTEAIFQKENQKKDDYFYSTIKLINDTLEKTMIEDNNFLKNLLSNLNSLMNKSKLEYKNLNVDLESVIKHIEEDKEKLEIKKKIFQESSEKVESNVLKKLIEAFKKNEPFNESLESKDLFKELKINYINYNSSLENVNKLIEDCNNKQKSIMDIYDNFDSKYYDFINNVLNIFNADQSSRNNLFSIIREEIKEMTILYNKNYLSNKKMKKFSTIYHKNFFDLLKFENFKSKIKFLNVQNNDEFNRFIYTIELFRKNIGDIYPDISIEKEEERNKVREKLFELIKQTNNKISEEDKNELYKLLKEDDYYQKLFLSILNRLRSSSKFLKDKELIAMIGNMLNIIIDTSETKKDYYTANLCIILSQTFYYEDDKKKKIYIIDFIKKNNWLHNAEFWGNYINLQIIKEFFKYQDNNKEINLNIFMENNISNKIVNNVAEILFSQLIPNINNMVELNVDKKLIARICEEFINKYNYLDQDNIDTLYNLISQDKEEINSLREQAKREIIINYNNRIAETNNIKGKEKQEEKENKDEIKEIKEVKENKNKIIEEKNEIIEEKNENKENIIEIIEEKNEIKDNNNEIIKEIKEMKESEKEIIEEKNEIKIKESKESKEDKTENTY